MNPLGIASEQQRRLPRGVATTQYADLFATAEIHLCACGAVVETLPRKPICTGRGQVRHIGLADPRLLLEKAPYTVRGSERARLLCGVCADVCDRCADECEKYDDETMRRCAEACRRCAEECRRMAA